MKRSEAIMFRRKIENAAKTLSNEDAINSIELFPKWEANRQYSAGDKVRYDDILYEVIMEHISQDDWTPNVAVSLFVKVLVEGDTILPWEQPESTNPYMMGDKVSHKGQIWVSDYDDNVWEPGVFGWRNDY